MSNGPWGRLSWVVCVPLLACGVLLIAWVQRTSRISASEHSAAVPLGKREPLPSAAEILASPGMNPSGAQPSASDVARLQGIVDEVNAALAELEAQVAPAARNWAALLADTGAASTVAGTGDLHLPRGAIAVRTVTRDRGTRDVVIRPGDCGELDALALDMDAVRSEGESRVREFLAACMSNGRR